LSGGGGEEHLASGGASFAEIVVGGANAAAPTRELIAIFWVKVRLKDFRALPIAGKLLRDNHRQDRTDSLAHLGLATPDFHPAV
jgi:hypothetical protein